MPGPNQRNSWCFSWLELPAQSPGKDKAGLLLAARWEPGSAISVSFLDGDAAIVKRVRRIAEEWVGAERANLKFTWKNTGGIVRVSFKHRGAWSAIGKTCLNVTDLKKPTMNLGLTATTPAENFRRTVLHEFGHVLGLVHEHSTPAGGIKWDRAEVERAVQGPPYFWSKKQIQQNIFHAFTKKETNFTAFDARSIMLYPFPKNWTKNGLSSTPNFALSEMDVSAIRRWYPHE